MPRIASGVSRTSHNQAVRHPHCQVATRTARMVAPWRHRCQPANSELTTFRQVKSDAITERARETFKDLPWERRDRATGCRLGGSNDAELDSVLQCRKYNGGQPAWRAEKKNKETVEVPVRRARMQSIPSNAPKRCIETARKVGAAGSKNGNSGSR
jgi:hypothetical protein